MNRSGPWKLRCRSPNFGSRAHVVRHGITRKPRDTGTGGRELGLAEVGRAYRFERPCVVAKPRNVRANQPEGSRIESPDGTMGWRNGERVRWRVLRDRKTSRIFVGRSHESVSCFDTTEGGPKLRLRSSKRERRNGLLVCEVNAPPRKRDGESYRADGTDSVVPRRRHGTSGFGSLRVRLSQPMNSAQGVRARDAFRAITSSVRIVKASDESSGMHLSS